MLVAPPECQGAAFGRPQVKAKKRIGSDARQDIITLVDSPVHLQLWVKVKRGWTSDERAVRSLEYADDTFGQPRADEPDDS